MPSFPIDFLENHDEVNLIAELRRLAADLSRTTLSRRDIDRYGRASSSVFIKKFGSLRVAHQRAGLVPYRFNKATKNELLAMLIQLWTQTLEQRGRSPYRNELKEFGYPISGDTYVRRFGSWAKALIAATIFADSIESVPELDSSTAKMPPQYFLEPRRAISIRTRFLVFKRDNYTCQICRRSGLSLEVDHKYPYAKGGGDDFDNLQTLCFECNRGKRDSIE